MARAPRRSEESLAGIPLKADDLGLRSVNDGQTENVYAEDLRFWGQPRRRCACRSPGLQPGLWRKSHHTQSGNGKSSSRCQRHAGRRV